MSITITETQAETIIEAMEWMIEDIDAFHFDGCEYDDDPDKAAAELEAQQKRYDETVNILKAKLLVAKEA